MSEIKKAGGLTFDFSSDENGWVAQSKEIPGIIAGGSKKNPSEKQIESSIRKSIFAAFDVKIEKKQNTHPSQKRCSVLF